METQTQLKYVLYARKSTEQDERQAMSIDSQIKEMVTMAQRDDIQVLAVKQESHSAKLSAKRPVFNEMLEEITEGKFDAILTWAPDRLSRNAGDLGSLVDLMDAGQLQGIKTFGQSFRNNPNEKFLLMILCSQTKLENDNRAINVKHGIRAKCEMGWRPCMPPLGYFTRAGTGKARDIILDEERAPYIRQIFEMSADGKSGRFIKQWLDENNATTRNGKRITLSMVYKILENTFYYGDFEHPKGSGHWYQGNHPPVIDKELFDRVRTQLTVPMKPKWGANEFPFKQFLRCYTCGAMVVGEEKFKARLDGTKKKFVYYHCSRQIRYDCPEQFVREEAIIEELSSMCYDLMSDDTQLEQGLRKALDKYEKMARSMNENLDPKTIRGNFVKYILNDGTGFEKTRLIRNLDAHLMLHDRKLVAA